MLAATMSMAGMRSVRLGEPPARPCHAGIGYVGIERDWARDPGQAFWRQRLGSGVLKEIGWGLRPQVGIELARQVNDGPLAPFGRRRGDWLQRSFSIYKRDWSFRGSRHR